jgi:hypothetical protein
MRMLAGTVFAESNRSLATDDRRQDLHILPVRATAQQTTNKSDRAIKGMR